MNNILNLLFYIFGVGIPILILFITITNKSKRKNLFNTLLISVIIFLVFYIVKIGGISLMSKVNDNKTIKTTLIKQKFTSKTTKEITITSPKTTTITTTIKTTTSTNPIVNNNSIKYVDGVLIVNKTYSLPSNYVPTNTYKDASGVNYCSNCLDAKALGLNIWIQSGYRSYSLQESLYNKYVNRDGKEAADTYSARPGHSEHQTGLAFDLNSISDDFQYTNEGIWINNNCYKYGFILRYPKGKEHITGYKYESWHLRYVGEELSTKLYNNGDWITLEEYFNLTSTYSD